MIEAIKQYAKKTRELFKLILLAIKKYDENKKFNDYQNGIKAARKEIMSNGYQKALWLIDTTEYFESKSQEFINGYRWELNNGF